MRPSHSFAFNDIGNVDENYSYGEGKLVFISKQNGTKLEADVYDFTLVHNIEEKDIIVFETWRISASVISIKEECKEIK